MSLVKNYLKTKPICKVSFHLSKQIVETAEKIALVGDFNEWNPKTNEMKLLKTGGFSATIELEKGKEYQFRYLINDSIWANDESADKYIRTEYGSENSVVIV